MTADTTEHTPHDSLFTDETALAHALQEQVDLVGRHHRVTGVAVGLSVAGRRVYACHGLARHDQPVPVTPDTLFHTGSVTKTFTALALVRLAQQGKLDLNARVADLLPDFRVRDAHATSGARVEDLLTHVAGWQGDFFVETGDGDDATARYVTEMRDLPQIAPLGQLWSYNNASFVVAGRLIETVTGTSYRDALADLVLKPLGLTRSFLRPADVMPFDFAAGHLVKAQSTEIFRPWEVPRSLEAAGALTSNVKDLLTYAEFHFDPSPDVLTRAALDDMLRPRPAGHLDERQGLGWWLRDLGGARAVHHGGNTPGQGAMLWFVPERATAVAILTNADTGRLAVPDLLAWVQRHLLGLPAPADTTADAVVDADLTPYEGTYEYLGSGDRLLVEQRGGTLYLQALGGAPSMNGLRTQAQPPQAVEVLAGDRVRVKDGLWRGMTAEFVRDDRGDVRYFRNSRAYVRST